MGEVIVITSGKGGVGKSTVSANLGAALAMAGKKILLIDTDIGLRNLDIALGLEDKIVYDIVDVCNGECEVKKAALKDKRFENLYLIPAAQAKDKYAITPMQMKNVTEHAKNDFDYIIIDSPAGIEQGFENAVSGAETAIVTVMPEKTSVRDADRVIGLLERSNIKKIYLLINKMRPQLMSVEEILDALGVDLLGVVPEDINIAIGSNCGEPCVLGDKTKGKLAFENIAKRLMGEKIDLIDYSKEKNVFLRIMEAIKR